MRPGSGTTRRSRAEVRQRARLARDLDRGAAQRLAPARDPRPQLAHRLGGAALGGALGQRHDHLARAVDRDPDAAGTRGAADAVLGSDLSGGIAADQPTTPLGGCHHGARCRSRACPCRTALPSPSTVYLNGVRQQPGRDFQVRAGALVFDRELSKEGKLGFWRWFLGAWGIGTYGKNDQVDVAWETDGRPIVAHALEIERAP